MNYKNQKLTDELLAALADGPFAHLVNEHQPEPINGGIRLGPVEVLPGRSAKPVVRDAVTKRALKGSGAFPRGKPITDVVRVNTSKRDFEKSQTYREALEILTPMFGADQQSLERLLDVLWRVIEGVPTPVKCTHQGCQDMTHMYYPKPDGNAAFKLLENLVGRAAQTQNVNIKDEKLVQILEQRTVNVVVQGISEADANDRRELISTFGYLS